MPPSTWTTYLRWADDGFLSLTPGNLVDHSAVIVYLNDLAKRFAVQEVVIDRWNL